MLGHQIVLFARDELLRTYNIDKPKPRFSTYKYAPVKEGRKTINDGKNRASEVLNENKR